jgi:hypothetical protein
MSNDGVVVGSPNQPIGKVGYFWIVMDRAGRDAILGEAIEVAGAEMYGDLFTHPGGHCEFWEKIKRRGPAWLRSRNLTAALLSTEYEDWPRGRVVFSPSQYRFIAYADPRIQKPERIALVREMFDLPGVGLVVFGDSHYQPSSANSMIEDEEM